MKSFVLFVVCMFVFCVSEKTQAQDEWQVGVGIAIVRFTDPSAFGNEQHSFQIPRLNVTKKINEKLSIDGAISFNSFEIPKFIDNKVSYFSIDSFLRYSLIKDVKFINPYAFVGASLVSIDIKLNPTINFGFGNTFWVLKNLGLNGQVIFKLSEKTFSHFQFTGGIVYNLDLGRRALWD